MKKCVLCILDGFGLGDKNYKFNAVFKSNIPNLKRFLEVYPYSMLKTSGLSVGLPEGQMGNSEVGHMTIGSGRVLMQDLPLISEAIENDSIWQNPQILKITQILNKTGGRLHILGLCSEGGVHSHLNHIIKIADHFKEKFEVLVHAISDGRDVPTNDFLKNINKLVNLNVATLCGRFFIMDRDNKLERTEKGIELILNAKGNKYNSLADAVDAEYQNNRTDEFIEPCIIGNYNGVQEGDVILFANFRADRARQGAIELIKSNRFAEIFTMMEYSSEISKSAHAIFKKTDIKNTLSEVISKNKLKQFKIAETEKYAHITFFLNGGIEIPFEGEERLIVPSPKVKTYDLMPEMSLPIVEEKMIEAINSNKFDFIACNIANGDMVGHTGNFEAAIKAMERIDEFLGKLEDASINNDYTVFITADHGNLEEMLDKNGEVHTQHTTTDVPLIVLSKDKLNVKNGTLADIAPTMLYYMSINIPNDMTGKILLQS